MPSFKAAATLFGFLLATGWCWWIVETDWEWACAALAFCAGSLGTHFVYDMGGYK
jgi:hypothetical protein